MLQERRGKNQPITGKLLFTFGVGAPSKNVTRFILVILIHLPHKSCPVPGCTQPYEWAEQNVNSTWGKLKQAPFLGFYFLFFDIKEMDKLAMVDTVH